MVVVGGGGGGACGVKSALWEAENEGWNEEGMEAREDGQREKSRTLE